MCALCAARSCLLFRARLATHTRLLFGCPLCLFWCACAQPNAYAKVVNIDTNNSKIILFAKRAIEVGEEVVYDYKFAPDGDTSSGCNCGSKNCSGFLGGA